MKEFNEIISLLKELHKDHPSYNLGRHLSTALSDYGDVWGMSDRELLFALTKYRAELELDVPHVTTEKDIEEIIRGGMDLFSIDEKEEEEY